MKVKWRIQRIQKKRRMKILMERKKERHEKGRAVNMWPRWWVGKKKKEIFKDQINSTSNQINNWILNEETNLSWLRKDKEKEKRKKKKKKEKEKRRSEREKCGEKREFRNSGFFRFLIDFDFDLKIFQQLITITNLLI